MAAGGFAVLNFPSELKRVVSGGIPPLNIHLNIHRCTADLCIRKQISPVMSLAFGSYNLDSATMSTAAQIAI
jgi:hypothetical protein